MATQAQATGSAQRAAPLINNILVPYVYGVVGASVQPFGRTISVAGWIAAERLRPRGDEPRASQCGKMNLVHRLAPGATRGGASSKLPLAAHTNEFDPHVIVSVVGARDPRAPLRSFRPRAPARHVFDFTRMSGPTLLTSRKPHRAIVMSSSLRMHSIAVATPAWPMAPATVRSTPRPVAL